MNILTRLLSILLFYLSKARIIDYYLGTKLRGRQRATRIPSFSGSILGCIITDRSDQLLFWKRLPRSPKSRLLHTLLCRLPDSEVLPRSAYVCCDCTNWTSDLLLRKTRMFDWLRFCYYRTLHVHPWTTPYFKRNIHTKNIHWFPSVQFYTLMLFCFEVGTRFRDDTCIFINLGGT